MKETTRHIILAAKNRYEKQGGIKAVVSKITGVEEKHLEKRAITYWYRDACNDMKISKDKIIDSIIKKTQSFREYENYQDIIIEALKLQLTLLNVLDEHGNVVLELGEPDLFNDETIKLIGFPPNLTTFLINSDGKNDNKLRIPLQFIDRKNGFIEKKGYIPILNFFFIFKDKKFEGVKLSTKETSGNFIDMNNALNYNDKLKTLNYIKDNLTRIEKSFSHFTDKSFSIVKDNIDMVIDGLSSDNDDN
jgi:hypothetical protein